MNKLKDVPMSEEQQEINNKAIGLVKELGWIITLADEFKEMLTRPYADVNQNGRVALLGKITEEFIESYHELSTQHLKLHPWDPEWEQCDWMGVNEEAADRANEARRAKHANTLNK